MDQENLDQLVHNEDIFGPMGNSTVVIAIQVHKRRDYLEQLILSLSQARGIGTALLIFRLVKCYRFQMYTNEHKSKIHDLWDEDINSLIQSIDFAKWMQIYYPYSIQTHNGKFPGDSPGDCSRNAGDDQNVTLNCTSAMYPDQFGHYRKAKFAQLKHHWWWKANYIFDQLRVTRHHSGHVIFMEEDYMVSHDFLHMLGLVESERVTRHSNCDVISLGERLERADFHRFRSNLVEVVHWSQASAMAMAFTRDFWKRIREECAETFCHFDDYNYDWSLLHVGQKCLKDQVRVLLMKAPRVFHIGECGTHYHGSDCNATLAAENVRDMVGGASNYLFPKTVVVTVDVEAHSDLSSFKGNGGWADPRDHQLCMSMTVSNHSAKAGSMV